MDIKEATYKQLQAEIEAREYEWAGVHNTDVLDKGAPEKKEGPGFGEGFIIGAYAAYFLLLLIQTLCRLQ